MNMILEIGLCIIGILIIILLFYFLDILKNKLSFEKEKYYTSIDFKENTRILNELIQEEFEKYIVLNVSYEKDKFITEENQLKMITDLTTNVFKRITPAILCNLILLYNVNTDKDIINVLSHKISFIVIDYASKNNELK